MKEKPTQKTLGILILFPLLLSACMPGGQQLSNAQIQDDMTSSAAQIAQPLAGPSIKPTISQASNQAYEQVTEVAQGDSQDSSMPKPIVTTRPDTETASKQTLALGPDQFAEGVNPLTGLPVQDPASLALPPALISVTNFPVSARPQAGLSYAPYVFELFIGEGMTRFLALFYGDYPDANSSPSSGSELALDKAGIGPIRSGRLPYQKLRSLYNGFLVMASASGEVRTQLSNSTNIYGSDNGDINSALIDVTRLQEIAQANTNGKEHNLTGNLFSLEPPSGGQRASDLWVFYSFLNQVLWTYDSASHAYLRNQDNADGSGEFLPSTDRLTGEQLAFENVVVLYARHNALNSARTLIDLELLHTREKAYLFRDGVVYPIYWTTAAGDYEKQTGLLRPIRFVDRDGNPFPLKPGKTWVEIVDLSATLTENESGHWKARFYAP